MADGLAERVEDLWHAARELWPGVEVPFDTFAAHVRAHASEPAAELDEAALAALNLTDLYLACACLQRVPEALATFERVFLTQVAALIARVDRSPALADEVTQLLREKLFLASATRPPGLASYQGRGSLMGWLRTAAVRVAYDLMRERQARSEVAFDEDAVADVLAGDAELAVVKAQHRHEFQEAVVEALRRLQPRQRNLLRLHLSSGVSTRKLSTMLNVDQSTVVRWLAAARATVRELTLARLRERLGLSVVELDSLVGLLLSGLDVSLGGCLRTSDD